MLLENALWCELKHVFFFTVVAVLSLLHVVNSAFLCHDERSAFWAQCGLRLCSGAGRKRGWAIFCSRAFLGEKKHSVLYSSRLRKKYERVPIYTYYSDSLNRSRIRYNFFSTFDFFSAVTLDSMESIHSPPFLRTHKLAHTASKIVLVEVPPRLFLSTRSVREIDRAWGRGAVLTQHANPYWITRQMVSIEGPLSSRESTHRNSPRNFKGKCIRCWSALLAGFQTSFAPSTMCHNK